MRPYEAVIYGAYGYTGQLVVRECKSRGLNVLLSGRDVSKLQALSEATDFPYESCDIGHPAALASLLRKAILVIHCAGPFSRTALPMVEACLTTNTHYLDITGEYEVFEALAALDGKARRSNILLMPGVGFDVVPSDCLAVHLKSLLPRATHLTLAFATTGGGMSRGTARTMVEGLGRGAMVRFDGQLTPVPLGRTLEVDFGPFRRTAMCIPWGDIATAWRSTGIPNIEVYTAVPPRAARIARASGWFNWLLRKQWVKDFLRKKVDARPAGPGEKNLREGATYLWGRAHDADGNAVEARMKTSNGYLLTAEASVIIAQKLLAKNVRSGYHTPAQYFGKELVSEVPGTIWS